MKGIFIYILSEWPLRFEHNDKNSPEKKLRYTIGNDRIAFLRDNAQPFAYAATEQGQQVAYLTELDEYDIDPRMPKSTKFEYIAGILTDNSDVRLFAYLWFDSLVSAKEYAKRHGMKIQGGWGG